MKRLFFILFISCFISCNDNTEPAYSRKVEILPYKQFKEITKIAQQQRKTDSLKKLTLEYGIYHDKKDIPQAVMEYLSKKYPDPFSKKGWSITNPDEKANLSCILNGLPRRKLIALAKKENYCVLYYLQGGGGVFADIMIIKLNDDLVIKDSVFQAENRDDFMKIVKKLSQKR